MSRPREAVQPLWWALILTTCFMRRCVLAEATEVPKGDLTLSINYFASWYMGLHYPVTDYANVYAQAGFSFIHGTAEITDANKPGNAQFRDLTGDFPDSSFSVSWVFGMDVEVLSDTYLVFEGGKLFKDTNTGANTFQFSTGLKYEF